MSLAHLFVIGRPFFACKMHVTFVLLHLPCMRLNGVCGACMHACLHARKLHKQGIARKYVQERQKWLVRFDDGQRAEVRETNLMRVDPPTQNLANRTAMPFSRVASVPVPFRPRILSVPTTSAPMECPMLWLQSAGACNGGGSWNSSSTNGFFPIPTKSRFATWHKDSCHGCLFRDTCELSRLSNASMQMLHVHNLSYISSQVRGPQKITRKRARTLSPSPSPPPHPPLLVFLQISKVMRWTRCCQV